MKNSSVSMTPVSRSLSPETKYPVDDGPGSEPGEFMIAAGNADEDEVSIHLGQEAENKQQSESLIPHAAGGPMAAPLPAQPNQPAGGQPALAGLRQGLAAIGNTLAERAQLVALNTHLDTLQAYRSTTQAALRGAVTGFVTGLAVDGVVYAAGYTSQMTGPPVLPIIFTFAGTALSCIACHDTGEFD